jgi:hypothetical protein
MAQSESMELNIDLKKAAEADGLGALAIRADHKNSVSGEISNGLTPGQRQGCFSNDPISF